MTKLATKVRVPSGYRGDAAVYRLSPPYDWDEDGDRETLEEVVCSSVDDLLTGPETLVFPLHVAGEDESVDLYGVGGGRGLDHREALETIGYVLVAEAPC